MEPIISIIVPVYNVEPYIRPCIDSILNQTFSDIEVILVNDGSTDNSGVICDEYANNDERVKVIHKEYGGVSSARNVGIQNASGYYIGFVDGDDRISKDMYKELHRLSVSTNSDIAICKLGRVINGQLINQEHNHYVKELEHMEAMKELFKGVLYRFSLCNKLFHRKCFKDIIFPEGRIHEDLSTTYKLFANANKAIYTNKIGYIYVKRENSILTSKYHEKRLEAFIGWDEILPFMNNNYPQLMKEVSSSFGYWCIDNVYYILNQVEDKEEKSYYLTSIQQRVRRHYKQIIKHGSFSLVYKYLISLLNYNVRLLVITNQVKRSLVRG